MSKQSQNNHGDPRLDADERLAFRRERERLRDRETALDEREAALDMRERELDERQKQLDRDQAPVGARRTAADSTPAVIIDLPESSDERGDDDFEDFLEQEQLGDIMHHEEAGDHAEDEDRDVPARGSIDWPTGKRLRSGTLRSDASNLGGLERPAKRPRQQFATSTPASTPSRAGIAATQRAQRDPSTYKHFQKSSAGKKNMPVERMTIRGLLPGHDTPTALDEKTEAWARTSVRSLVNGKYRSLMRRWARRGNKANWDCVRSGVFNNCSTSWHSEESKRKFACHRCETGGWFCIIAEPEGEGEFVDSVVVLPMRDEARLEGARPDSEFGFWRLDNRRR